MAKIKNKIKILPNCHDDMDRQMRNIDHVHMTHKGMTKKQFQKYIREIVKDFTTNAVPLSTPL